MRQGSQIRPMCGCQISNKGCQVSAEKGLNSPTSKNRIVKGFISILILSVHITLCKMGVIVNHIDVLLMHKLHLFQLHVAWKYSFVHSDWINRCLVQIEMCTTRKNFYLGAAQIQKTINEHKAIKWHHLLALSVNCSHTFPYMCKTTLVIEIQSKGNVNIKHDFIYINLFLKQKAKWTAFTFSKAFRTIKLMIKVLHRWIRSKSTAFESSQTHISSSIPTRTKQIPCSLYLRPVIVSRRGLLSNPLRRWGCGGL